MQEMNSYILGAKDKIFKIDLPLISMARSQKTFLLVGTKLSQYQLFSTIYYPTRYPKIMQSLILRLLSDWKHLGFFPEQVRNATDSLEQINYGVISDRHPDTEDNLCLQ